MLGVSRDSVKSHDNFCAKQGFTFPLISDSDEALCRAFDVIKERTCTANRCSASSAAPLLSPDGHVVQEWRKVKVAGHAEAVLAAVKAHAKQ